LSGLVSCLGPQDTVAKYANSVGITEETISPRTLIIYSLTLRPTIVMLMWHRRVPSGRSKWIFPLLLKYLVSATVSHLPKIKKGSVLIYGKSLSIQTSFSGTVYGFHLSILLLTHKGFHLAAFWAKIGRFFERGRLTDSWFSWAVCQYLHLSFVWTKSELLWLWQKVRKGWSARRLHGKNL